MDRILVVHNRYRSAWPSGEDRVFEAEVDQLRRHGHDVATFERDNDTIRGGLHAATVALGSIWNPRACAALRGRIAEHRPDVVHFHNTFPLISPAALRVARDSGAAVVMTLHNFRIACVAGSFFRAGEPCHECLGSGDRGGSSWPAVRHGCYRGSRLATLAPALGQAVHRARKSWTRNVDRFICPSRFAQDQAIGFGLPAGRVRTKAHFLHPEPEPATAHGGDALFLGRVDEVKGADLLIEAWREVPGLSLTVVGDGPIRARLERVVAERGNVNIRFAGQLSYDRCQELLRDAGLLVFPSRGFETFGLALRDAMAFGKPILAGRRGAAAELIEHETSGLLFEPDSPADLASEARRLHGDVELRQRLGRGARAKFEKLMRDGPAYRKLIEIYEEAQVQRQR